MDVEVLRWVQGALGMGMERYGWVRAQGGTGIDLKGLGWVWNIWDGYRGSRWVRTAGDWCGASRMGVYGQGIVWGPRIGIESLIWSWRPLGGCGGLEMSVKGLILV